MYLVTVNLKAVRDEAGHVRTFETMGELHRYIETNILPAWTSETPPRLTIEFADGWKDPEDAQPLQHMPPAIIRQKPAGQP